MPVQTVIKVRRDTAANWISTNPVLASGEMGLETDTELFKFGNGTAAWTALAYSSSSRTTQIAKNDTGASAAKGSVVYISGANGSNALFSLADADAEATSSKTVGLLAQTLAINGIGAVVTEGLLSGVNTGTATAGQSVWLSSTAGQFVFNAPPAKPAHSVYLGVVTRAHSTQGEILVKVQNGYELNELHDVNAGAPSDNNVLAWDDATSMWTNQTVAGIGAAAASHTHAQSDITNLTSDLAAKAPLASPTFTGTTVVSGALKVQPVIEKFYTTTTAFNGAYYFDVLTNGSLQYMSTAATGFGSVQIRGSSTVPLNTLMSVGESLTITLLITNGATAYRPYFWRFDGGIDITMKWLGAAPTAGNANAIDAYTVTVTKTGDNAFLGFGSVSKFV